MTQSSAPAGAGFEPSRNTNKTILWVALGMLALLAVLLGVAFLVYREGPPTTIDPTLDPTEGTLPQAPPAPIEPQP